MEFKTKKQANIVATTYSLLKAHKAHVTNITLARELESHPDYPSLSAVSEVLEGFNIENYVVEITDTDFIEAPTPCLAVLNNNILVLINSIENEIVDWWHFKNGKKKEPINTFIEKWSGTLLLISVSDKSGEKHFESNIRKEKLEKIGKKLLNICISIII